MMFLERYLMKTASNKHSWTWLTDPNLYDSQYCCSQNTQKKILHPGETNTTELQSNDKKSINHIYYLKIKMRRFGFINFIDEIDRLNDIIRELEQDVESLSWSCHCWSTTRTRWRRIRLRWWNYFRRRGISGAGRRILGMLERVLCIQRYILTIRTAARNGE